MHKATAEGLVMLADPAYEGAGVGVRTPIKRPPEVDERRRHVDDRAHNRLLRGLRCIGERAMAVLTGRWRALRHTTTGPSKIGMIVQAALALTNIEKQTR
ncbi:transposase family protein [Nocardiopsis xinjiangensis]|uniref:transposase family protein n=1 Tax=Nocardiopsis xinjiangensis TaxID=124285 RepID=UPI00034CB044|nr:transposase family protein [Nocardiopsis xinjiangensis]